MEIKEHEYEKLVQQVVSFSHMYQQARIIDPVNKKIVYVRKNSVDEIVAQYENCYDIWSRNEVCVNCISMRAYNENDLFIKVSPAEDSIMMVTAIPVTIDNEILVVELLKDVTNSMILDNSKITNNNEVIRLLELANIAAVTDELTGIYNKRYINEKLPVDMMMSNLQDEPLSLLIADIDLFKNVNDTYGHMAGDYILKEFARIIKENLRDEKDWVARFGGEEFIICLKNTEKNSAKAVAERLRKSIKDHHFDYNGTKIHITSSFGISELKEDKVKDYESLLKYADDKLYQAKSTGRNKTMM